MSEKQIIKLLKSGNFTIAYHDSQAPSLYKGKIKYDELPPQEDYEFMRCNFEGYIPEVVLCLVKALGGKIETI